MLTIVKKLERHGYVPVSDFVRIVNDEMALVDVRYADCSPRTLQRDFKTLPLHGSQTIVSEDNDSVTFKLHLRITNDICREMRNV